MHIAFASDHSGSKLKSRAISQFRSPGHDVHDVGVSWARGAGEPSSDHVPVEWRRASPDQCVRRRVRCGGADLTMAIEGKPTGR